ncbi:MAG: glycosyltransferase family protein [Planctomycetes bacterium]|nr:glycosyltransferase family protein [Planctomycetota bacterium]
MKIVASVEARMGSSRLPGKVLAEVCGAPALTRLLGRLRRARLVDSIVLATTDSPRDDALADRAAREGVPCFRGSEEDVLARGAGAHRSLGSDLVVEVTGDTPLLDPEVIDWGVGTFLANDCDVVSNVRNQTFPQGIDIHVFRLAALEEVERTVSDPAVREHVSLYFYEHPERYRVFHLVAPARWRAPELRLLLDYPEDLAFLRELYARLAPAHGDRFGLDEILALLRREPGLASINRACEEKPVRPAAAPFQGLPHD